MNRGDATQIVIVEDDVWFGEQLSDTLTRDKMCVRVATHAAAAMELIDEYPPDVIILDMLLAGSTGLILLHELQSHRDLATIPVVICSTIVDEKLREELRPYGVRRVLDKTTMQPDDVLAAVRGVLA